MKWRLLLPVFLLCSLCAGAQKNNVVEMGPGIGFSLPQALERNSNITKPMSGAVIGFELNTLTPVKDKRFFYSVGFQLYGFYFSSPPNIGEGGTAVGLFGLSIGLPVKAHMLIPIAKATAVWCSAGIVPLVETSGLVKTTVKDCGLRFNGGPDASVGFMFNNQTAVSIACFMPVRVYGDPSQSYTYHLYNFTFNVHYCLPGKHFKF